MKIERTQVRLALSGTPPVDVVCVWRGLMMR